LGRPAAQASLKHRFWTPAERIEAGQVQFSVEQAHQLRSVLRLQPGDQVRVFDGFHRVDYVVELTADCLHGRIVGQQPQPPEPQVDLIAYPTLLPRDKFEVVLQKLTEVGVRAIVPVITARSLVREPPDPPRQTRWQMIIREAAEQSGRGHVPELHTCLLFREAIDRALGQGTTLMAYEREPRLQLHEALKQHERVISLFVGPEGGFTPEEAQAGARLVSLGPRVLRTETASPVFAMLVLYELGELG
jgi:16S rRNA (uracil1498-N3)-methyltransferase